MKTLAIAFFLLFSSLHAQAQIDELKSLLTEGKGKEALEIIAAIEGPLSAEIQHLKAISNLQRDDLNTFLGVEDRSIEEQYEAYKQFIEADTIPLLTDASQGDYAPAKYDLALLLSIGEDSLSQVSYSLILEAADEGYWPAEALLFSSFCQGNDNGILEAERFSPIEFLNRLDLIAIDTDDEPDFFNFFGNLDDDDILLPAIGNAVVSLAVGTCSEVNKEAAKAAFDSLIHRPGGHDQAIRSLRNLLSHIEEDHFWRPDARNAISPDAVLALEWKQFGLYRQILSILSAVDLFNFSLNGELAQPDELLARATLDEIIRLTELEQKKDFSVWESALMSLSSYAESAADSMLFSGPSVSSAMHTESATDLRFSRPSGFSTIIQEAMIFAADELHSEYPSYWRYNSIAEKFENGEVWPKDLAKAVRYYEKAAAIDDPLGYSAFKLGWHYSDEENAFADGSRAVYWYASAFENGRVNAAYNNGIIFEFGKVIEQSDKKALFWYQKAADAGDADGMIKVGVFHDLGKGVPENDTTAYSWYLKAAELGNVDAQFNIGLLLMNGEGVPVDLTQSYKWLNLAQANGAENARNIKNSLSQRMSRAQIQEAQRLSAAWKPKDSVDEILSANPGTAPANRSVSAYNRSVVTTIQSGLSELGYYEGTIDGLYGPVTASAIRQFQTDLDMEIDTTPSSDLALQIGAMLGMRFVLDEESQTENSKPEPRGSGSGFVVTESGHVVTNAHVVAGCSSILVQGADTAYIEDTDEFIDLALVKADFSRRQIPLSLRSGRGIRLGDDIMVAGYPLSNILGNSVRVTTGSVSSLSGIGGDRASFQISAPIQPGNSGGPVLDENADVVGVVVSKLDALTVASQTGDIPQNVNFAISLGMLKAFLDANGVDYPASQREVEKSTNQIATIAERSTVQILCN